MYIPSASWFIQVNYQRCNKYNKCFFNDKSEDIYKRGTSCQHMDGCCKPSLWKTYFDGQNLCNNLTYA